MASAPSGQPATIPEPTAQCSQLEAAEVKALLERQAAAAKTNKDATRDFLLVDVRRNDHDGGTIATSLNLPAQSLYQTRPIIHQLCKQAGIKQVITYCGSSTGRGPRCAGWLQDYFDSVGEQNIKAVVLKGGIKGWVKTYGAELVEGYDAAVWSDPPACPDRR